MNKADWSTKLPSDHSSVSKGSYASGSRHRSGIYVRGAVVCTLHLGRIASSYVEMRHHEERVARLEFQQDMLT